MRQRQRRQRAQPRIATDGLPVIEQHDRLPIRRHLHRPQRDPFGNHRLALVVQRRAQQTHAHAVGTAVEGPGAVEGIEQALATELADLRPHDQIQWRIEVEIRYQSGPQLPYQQRRIGVATQQRALDQRMPPAVQPAQFLAHYRRTTAQHLRRLETAWRGQVRPCAQ
ncbi:hypothetical protein D3C73_1125570 [compost metagenome]